MARSIWSGNISFGLVTIPIQLHSVVKDTRLKFHMLTPDGDCRLRQKLYCPETGKEYDFADTAKGYEVAPDQYVLVERDEFKKLQPESGRNIEILDFVDLDTIDPIYYNRPYYALPDKRSAKPYALLVESMKKSGRVAIAKFVMREHEYLCAIRVVKGILCVETMYFADEIVSAEDLKDEVRPERIGSKERELAEQLIDTLYSTFDPQKYHHEYKEKMIKLLKQKSKGKNIRVPEAEPAAPTKVVDLLAVLKKSVKGRSDKPKAKAGRKRVAATGHKREPKKARRRVKAA